MLFNSIEFAIFLPIIFFFYWFILNKNFKSQNILLVIASYIFYGWWDVRFLTLIIISSLVDYYVGRSLSTQNIPSKRKILLWLSLLVNIGLLGFFKYFNFFVESFVDVFSLFGHSFNPQILKIILPVGISFYTFQTLSYTIDVYRRKIEPTDDLIAFLAFVSFFPQLVAGPIERATHLLPQFRRNRDFNCEKASDGMRQILWGLFKKMVIADNCALLVNVIFKEYQSLSGSTLLLGSVFFAFQIYGDFSGYSDIAIGTSRLFGFDLMRNFAFPYFSRDIAEFWRRWHISLSTWFRDYVYIPLGGSQGGIGKTVRNIFIIFLVSGFWHGANWTFIVWGGIHALYFLPLVLLKKNRKYLDFPAAGNILPSVQEFFQIVGTFCLTLFAWIFFRAESLTHAISYIKRMFSISLFSPPEFFPLRILNTLILFILIEWIQREKQHGLDFQNMKISRPFRWGIYYVIIFYIIIFGGQPQEFIYFQF